MTVVSNSECGGNLMLLTYSNDITQVSVDGNNGFVHTESSQIIALHLIVRIYCAHMCIYT